MKQHYFSFHSWKDYKASDSSWSYKRCYRQEDMHPLSRPTASCYYCMLFTAVLEQQICGREPSILPLRCSASSGNSLQREMPQPPATSPCTTRNPRPLHQSKAATKIPKQQQKEHFKFNGIAQSINIIRVQKLSTL